MDGDGDLDAFVANYAHQPNKVWLNQTDLIGDTTPPEITPNVSGTLGNNGWYISDVTVHPPC